MNIDLSEGATPTKPILYVLESGNFPGQYRVASFIKEPDTTDTFQRADLKVSINSNDFPGGTTEIQRFDVPHDEAQKVHGSWHWA